MLVRTTAFGLACLVFAACTDNSLSSDETARRAYLGLDKSISKSLQLGFDGFNAATSANIAPQMTAGDAAGTITVTGQVDQGSSANKGMRLHVGMVGYSDGKIKVNDAGDTVSITYDTSTDTTMQPALTLSLKGIPTGTLTGTLMGLYHLTGDIAGDVTLNLTITGTLQDGGGGKVVRAPGTTTVTGTAVSGGGTYNVMATI
ncbi:MAG: hypothetical protein JWO36_2784 [Myxococcales bacterium]|nr:hypothetical protein [Myxococcales bacterium]